MASRPPQGAASLALGTVQFGLDYGVSNRTGQVPEARAREILGAAHSAGVDLVDTAAAYGDAELLLARLLRETSGIRVVTKAPKVVNGDVDAALAVARRSADLFGAERLEAILLHSAADLRAHGDALWSGLGALREEGLTPRIGFSAYADDGPLALAERYRPDVVQVAASVFDQRLVASGQIAGMAELGVQVHVRSVFLQGLTFISPTELPAGLRDAAPGLERWRQFLAKNQVSPAHAAIDFARTLDGAARLVVGVTMPAELTEIIQMVEARPLDLDYSELAMNDPMILDPWRW